MKIKEHVSTKDNVWFAMEKEHNKNLNQKELETIDSIYFQLKLNLIKKVGLYRFINFVISAPILFIWIFLRENQYYNLFLGWCIVTFFVLNMINGFATYYAYRKYKKDGHV